MSLPRDVYWTVEDKGKLRLRSCVESDVNMLFLSKAEAEKYCYNEVERPVKVRIVKEGS